MLTTREALTGARTPARPNYSAPLKLARLVIGTVLFREGPEGVGRVGRVTGG